MPETTHRSSHTNVKRDLTLELQWLAKLAAYETARAARERS